MSKSVFVSYGKQGHNRTEKILEVLLKNNYNLYYNTLVLKTFKNSGSLKIFYYPLRILDYIITNIYNLTRILITDIYYVPAMAKPKILELVFAKIVRKSIVVDFYISNYDTFILDRQSISRSSLKGKKLYIFDILLLRFSKKLIFLSESERTHYAKIFGSFLFKKNYEIIRLLIDKTPQAELNYLNNTSNVFKIVWWGTFIPLHGLDKIIDAFKLAYQLDQNIQLYIFGDSPVRGEKYEILAKELMSIKVCFFNYDHSFNNGKLPEFLLRNADLSLGTFGSSQKANYILSNKVIEAINFKIPVITASTIGIKEIFSEKELWLCSNDPEDIARTILKMKNSDKRITIDKIKNSESLVNKYFNSTKNLSLVNEIFC